MCAFARTRLTLHFSWVRFVVSKLCLDPGDGRHTRTPTVQLSPQSAPTPSLALCIPRTPDGRGVQPRRAGQNQRLLLEYPRFRFTRQIGASSFFFLFGNSLITICVPIPIKYSNPIYEGRFILLMGKTDPKAGCLGVTGTMLLKEVQGLRACAEHPLGVGDFADLSSSFPSASELGVVYLFGFFC